MNLFLELSDHTSQSPLSKNPGKHIRWDKKAFGQAKRANGPVTNS
jgi:hypothetical protein